MAQVVSLSSVRVERGKVWWTEGRPQEAGRQVVVRDGADVLPAGFSARTRVHEYGGTAYAVGPGGTVFFSNFADQRLWRLDPGAAEPVPLTAEGDGARYADPVVTPDGRWVVCVRERHGADEVVNDLVAVAAVPNAAGLRGPNAAGLRGPNAAGLRGPNAAVLVLAEGHDFFAAPRLSPDGRRLAWLAWDHPNMPWDGTELWVADLHLVGATQARGGADAGVSGARGVAGGADESISQPRWSPAGTLHWISDRTGWWNLYAGGEPVAPMAAELARPDWVFGQSSYTFLADGRLVATWAEDGIGHLGVARAGEAGLRPIATPFTDISSLQPLGSEVVCIAASADRAPAVVAIDADTGTVRVIKPSRGDPSAVPADALSQPRPIAYPTEGGATAHAFFYPPRLEGYAGPAGERPPLIVRSHGGPTSAASTALNLEIQFWTSRGFAVVDVDYGGSTGYGRDYRRRLDGRWGIVDLDDCVNAARHLVAIGEVDPERLVVRGGSAGGYTTLCALAFRDDFAAGASYYGVADLETLATDTHKFESRYLDRLIGPYPRDREVYRRRSPIHAAGRISAPVILFQGMEDAVVPPSQSEVLVARLRENKVPFAYVTFEGEQHGFRRADTIRRAIEAELWFYGQVLGFEPAGPSAIEPVEIEHRDRLGARPGLT